MSAILNPRLAQFATPTLTAGEFTTLIVDASGNLKVAGTFSSAGTNTPTDNFPNPTDCSPVQAFMMGWDGTAWDRISAPGGVMAVSIGATVTVTGSNTPSDNFANPTNAIPSQGFMMGWDGTNWDRISAPGGVVAVSIGATVTVAGADTPSDTFTNPTNAVPAAAFMMGWTGAEWERVASVSGFVKGFTTGDWYDTLHGVVPGTQMFTPDGTYSAGIYNNTTFSAADSIKPSAGVLLSISCQNSNVLTRYLQIFDKASAPVLNDAPVFTFPVPAGGMLILGADFFTVNGAFFPAGIAFGFSTTQALFTAGSASDVVASGMYQ